MKKIAVYSLFAICIIIATVLVFNPRPVIGSGQPVPAGPGTELPDNISKLVQRACMDCHADDGNALARGKLNFSKWSTYDAAKQAKKMNAMCKKLTKGAMPPKKWRANNAADIPTQAEVDMVCKWAQGLPK